VNDEIEDLLRRPAPQVLAALVRHHRLHAVRAHLLEMAGDHEAAPRCYRQAARLATSLPEQHYLHSRAARLTQRP
jgi:predicted RNA polymerase sigma factor